MAVRIKIPRELSKIISDNSSGSSFLQANLNSFFLKTGNDFPLPLKYIPVLKKELKTFIGITAYLTTLEKIKTKEGFISALNNYSAEHTAKYDMLFGKASPFLTGCNKIVTLSNSKTVLEILLRLKKINKRLNVIVSESRPVNEGRITAKLLAAQKIKVDYITEAMLPAFIEKCDCALLGADMILKNGNVVNKTGSRLIALLCKEFDKPLYIVAEKSKVSTKTRYIPEKKSGKEVWSVIDKRINVHNYYFEEIDKKYIIRIFK